jgi:hypothetical protein
LACEPRRMRCERLLQEATVQAVLASQQPFAARLRRAHGKCQPAISSSTVAKASPVRPGRPAPGTSCRGPPMFQARGPAPPRHGSPEHDRRFPPSGSQGPLPAPAATPAPLGRRGAELGGHPDKGMVANETALLDRTVGHRRHAAFGQPREQIALWPATRQFVEDLIGRTGSSAVGDEFLHVVDVEVADAPAQDLARVDEPLHRIDRLAERHAAAPVQR